MFLSLNYAHEMREISSLANYKSAFVNEISRDNTLISFKKFLSLIWLGIDIFV